ncbi:hypothetical protein [Shewanella algae]|uniref:hypothetical protein n=1 Tax=Shewanella algae TaxID=38313 RepID=UPI001F1C0A28|nr:hypothetical protein [Shewanella algae]MCE9785935.1 hypothetical protein [Shewanella algae]
MLKKTLIASSLILGFSSIANAATATAVWTGEVPGSSPDTKIIITGKGGSLEALTGSVYANSDGTFTTGIIPMESHVYTGSAEDPVVGDLINVNWTISTKQVIYSGRIVDGANLEVIINGATVGYDDEISNEDIIETQLKQNAELPASEVAGTTVQAALTMIASSI